MTGSVLNRYIRQIPASPPSERQIAVESGVRIAQARAAGDAAGYERAREEMRAESAERERQVEERVVEERRTWLEAIGVDLRAQLEVGLAGIESRLADAVARVLAPFMSAREMERAIVAFSDVLRKELRDMRAVSVELRGPAQMIEAVAAALADVGANISMCVADEPAIEARIDDTFFRTRLKCFDLDFPGNRDE